MKPRLLGMLAALCDMFPGHDSLSSELLRFSFMIWTTKGPEVIQLPRTSLGHRDDVVHLQLGSRSAHLAGEPIPCKHLGPDGRPVTWAVQVPGRGVLPGLPGLVLSAPTIPVGLGDTAGSQADHCGSGHLCTSKVSGPGWILVWQPGPFAFLDLSKQLNLETISQGF